MPAARFFTIVFAVDELVMIKEAGPEIFFQSHSLIFPSGSLDKLPSSETLSVGKVITWSGPAFAIGGLLVVAAVDRSFVFRQDINIIIPIINIKAAIFSIGFMNERFYL